MPLYLIDNNSNGDAIGIWNDQGQSFYSAGQQDAQSSAQQTINAKGTSVPWSAWVEQLASSHSQVRYWGVEDTPELDMSKVLSQLQDHQTTLQNAQDSVLDRD